MQMIFVKLCPLHFGWNQTLIIEIDIDSKFKLSHFFSNPKHAHISLFHFHRKSSLYSSPKMRNRMVDWIQSGWNGCINYVARVALDARVWYQIKGNFRLFVWKFEEEKNKQTLITQNLSNFFLSSQHTQIFIGSWCQFSGSKIEIEYSAENTCGAFSIGDI